jgi:hypothetical protein
MHSREMSVTMRGVLDSGRWRLSARAERLTTWTVEASLTALEDPFSPCAVAANGRSLPSSAWRFDAAS